ncbi:hypothetical protein [Aeromonas hydrophila]|uniref:hypothetical protein n=1 Tax=Aeromonas hydrophila TaxID=644 RepID=UPI00131A5D0C|nr:hypothetical protein [Aeromonas hydrophila]ELA9379502.1 hypothetical protein [Aeromonas hydrophila]
MLEVTFEDIKATSDEFFRRHWLMSESKIPTWNRPWDLVGTLPGHDMQGIYILLGKHDEALYIGVGASLGGGKYIGHGLGSRTNKYTRMVEGQKGVPISEKKYAPRGIWGERGLSKIITLGFEQDYAYLSYGLEAYLLRESKTPYNKIRSARRLE